MRIINFLATDGINLTGILYNINNKNDKVILAIHGMSSNCFKERDTIIADNKELNNRVKELENEYKEKTTTLDTKFDNRKRELEKEFKEKTYDIEYEYKSKVRKLEKENSKLHRIIDKFYETIDRFIHWICEKFDMGAEDNLIRDFQKETNTFLDPEKQIKKEEREKEWDLER